MSKTISIFFFLLVILTGCKSLKKNAGLTSKDIAEQECTYIKDLLKPQGKMKFEDLPFSKKGTRLNTIIYLRWVSRMELKYRLKYWQSWLKDNTIPWGIYSSENDEEFVYFDKNIAAYYQTIIWRTNTTRSKVDIWRSCFEPEKGKEVCELIIEQFPKSNFVTTEPKDDAICVIMTYIENGELYVKHFYIESRIGIQSILYEVKQRGVDCNDLK